MYCNLEIRLMPMLTKATVEGSKYVNTSVALYRHGSLQNFTMELVVHVLLPLDELKMNVGYFVRLRNSDNWIYNKTYDFCAFLERSSLDRFSSIVFEDLKHRGNVPARCPVMPDRIIFKNVTLSRIKLPSFLPETSFGFTMNCFKGPRYEQVFRSNWGASLVKEALLVRGASLVKEASLVKGASLVKEASLVKGASLVKEASLVKGASPVTPTETKINVAFTVNQPLADLWMNMVLWVDVAAGAIKAPLQNHTLDFCKFLKTPSVHRLLSIIHREVKRSGNMPAGCPILPNIYQFRGLSTNTIRLPLFFPQTNFVMHVSVGFKNVLMPILTKATVEGSKYINTSVAIHRHGSLQNFTMELVVHVLLPLDDLRMNMGYFVRMRNSDNWIYNKTYDFCAFLERPSIDRAGSIVVEDLKHRGKVPARCPIMPERLVYSNVTLNRIKLPSFLPETSFGFIVNCFRGPKSEHLIPILSKMELTSSKYCNATGEIRLTHNSFFVDLNLDILERVTDAKFLLRPTLDRLMNLIREDLRHHGPMPTHCPIEKGLRNAVLLDIGSASGQQFLQPVDRCPIAGAGKDSVYRSNHGYLCIDPNCPRKAEGTSVIGDRQWLRFRFIQLHTSLQPGS
uniref:Uncharacterized protein n=1 Tax=Anopheles culicifacies TaxID=139723 RepID=A0A182LV43_9DIPT